MRLTQNGTTDNPVVERIILLLVRGKKTQQDLCDYLGIEKSAFTKWKSGKSQSYKIHIAKIAEYLGVSEAYLLDCAGEEVTVYNITSVEIELIRRFRKLDGTSQAWLTQAMQYALASNNKN